MSETLLKNLSEEILELIKKRILDNKIGLDKIGTDYWKGRLFDSEEVIKDIRDIIIKYSQ